jgi:glutathione S-transferase
MPRAKTVFDELARLLGDKPFMAGDEATLADIHIAPHLAMMAHTPEWPRLTADHRNLVAWLARMEARPSFMATTWQRVSEAAAAA